MDVYQVKHKKWTTVASSMGHWNKQFETPISLTSRISLEKESNGRFFLFPTQNIYNFILLDQLDGRVWQVQWSAEVKERMVVPIN